MEQLENISYFNIWENIGRYLLKFITTLSQIKTFSQHLFFLHLAFYDALLWLEKTYSENVGQYMKLKQLPFIEKFICLAILCVNSVYKFSEMYLSCSLNFSTNK